MYHNEGSMEIIKNCIQVIEITHTYLHTIRGHFVCVGLNYFTQLTHFLPLPFFG